MKKRTKILLLALMALCLLTACKKEEGPLEAYNLGESEEDSVVALDSILDEGEAMLYSIDAPTDQAIAEKLEGKKVVVTAKAGQNGRLFGTVTSKEVSAAIKQSLGCDVDKKRITLAVKIEGFGDFSAEARLYAGVSAKFTVTVTEG